MNHIKQHVPGYVNDGEGGEEDNFNTLDELMDLPLIKRYSRDFKNGDGSKEIFYRFSYDQDRLPQDGPPAYQTVLMAEWNEGKLWRVVGYLDNLEGIDLPLWKPVYE